MTRLRLFMSYVGIFIIVLSIPIYFSSYRDWMFPTLCFGTLVSVVSLIRIKFFLTKGD